MRSLRCPRIDYVNYVPMPEGKQAGFLGSRASRIELPPAVTEDGAGSRFGTRWIGVEGVGVFTEKLSLWRRTCRVARRSRAGDPQVVQDLAHGIGSSDHGQDLHAAVALRAGQGVD